MTSARKHVEDALTARLTRQVWSGDFQEVLPATLQDYELSAVLPAVFYMFRFGQRRGQGGFIETFGKKDGSPAERRRSVTVQRVAERLGKSDGLTGFADEDEVAQAILGDLLLCFCLENAKRAEGRDRQVQRISPAHYMASWADLPERVTYLRFVPEMIVALLANQKGEEVAVNEESDKTRFPVCRPHEENMLLRPFSRGVKIRPGLLDDLASDQFDESNADVGLDQLLTIRLASQLESAPLAPRGRGATKISNQRPLAELAGLHFSEDIRRFLRAYATEVPRHALVDMLESCVAVGMTTVLSHTTALLLAWAEEGRIPEQSKQKPAEVLVDCSNGVDRRIRDCAEQSMDDLTRRMARLPEILMVLRLLDYHAQHDGNIPSSRKKPIATKWINTLGDFLHKRHEQQLQAPLIHALIDRDTSRLADELNDDYPEVASALRNREIQPNAAWRLAHGLTRLMGPALVHHKFFGFIDSSLMTDRPNGIAVKRKTTRGGRRRDVRSLVLTDPALEYLAHVCLLPNGNKPGVRKLSFGEFVNTLRVRYGFCVDVAPPGMSVSNELLLTNRATLERRLRDLGLLAGVNDAETMKRLRPRFQPRQDD